MVKQYLITQLPKVMPLQEDGKKELEAILPPDHGPGVAQRRMVVSKHPISTPPTIA